MTETFVPVLACVGLLATLAASLVWVGQDARRRGKSPSRVVLLCLLTWPLGFLIWRDLRPPPRVNA